MSWPSLNREGSFSALGMPRKSKKKGTFIPFPADGLGFKIKGNDEQDTFLTSLLHTPEWEDDSNPNRGLGEVLMIQRIIIEVIQNKRRKEQSEDTTIPEIIAHAPFLAATPRKVEQALRLLQRDELMMAGARGIWCWNILHEPDSVMLRYLPGKERQQLREQLAKLAPLLK